MDRYSCKLRVTLRTAILIVGLGPRLGFLPLIAAYTLQLAF